MSDEIEFVSNYNDLSTPKAKFCPECGEKIV